MSLAYSPWLDDWRRFLDEAEISPAVRRQAEVALRRKEREWKATHERTYRSAFDNNRTTRNEKVVAGGEEMKAKLRQIRSDLASGKITPQEASGVIRDVTGWHQRTMALHDTLTTQDEKLEALAAMTPDQYQREFLGRFPPVLKNQPSLATVMDHIKRFGDSTPMDNEPAPADETPDWVGR